MRIGLLTDGGYPYATGESRLWCDRLVRGLVQHEFDIYALSRSARQEARGWIELPRRIQRVRTAPLWAPADNGRGYGRRDRRRFADHFGRLVTAVCSEPGEPGAETVGDAGAGAGAAGGPGASSGPGGPGGPGGSASAAGAGGFAAGLYGLADLARERGGLPGALRSEAAARLLESACRAPGARRSVQSATVPDFLAFTERLERALRPLSLDWYDDEALGAADLCHATSGGSAALPGLLAKRFFGVPLLVTEYGVQLRAHYLASAGLGSAPADTALLSAPVRALLAAFQGLLAAEVYRQAGVITPGNTHARRWQERCGADRATLRTVYPGMEAERFSAVGDGVGDGVGGGDAAGGGSAGRGGTGAGSVSGARGSVSGVGSVAGGGPGSGGTGGDPGTLVWVGRIEPAKDLVSLLHAFAAVRAAEPGARLRIVGAPAQGPGAAAYLAHCRALAAQLFPDEAADAHSVGDNPVSFEEIGGPEAPELPDAYAAGEVVVLSSVVEGFPISLVEAMFCGRATVSTDVGAVVEVIGGTGLVVPPRNPRALADACVALLRDPERRARLGAAARARALELFTVEQNLAAFHEIYLELISHDPVRRAADGVPFAHPAEMYAPVRWTAGRPVLPRRARTGARAGAGVKAGQGDA
ncbi:glycosyltransferase [Streptomyces sp. NPDC057617]|uniref:glycosyltransferase n=1 Tax=Streptomyces sp. NPDC057617 TaxID=3346184 RepID=UPI00367C3D56